VKPDRVRKHKAAAHEKPPKMRILGGLVIPARMPALDILMAMLLVSATRGRSRGNQGAPIAGWRNTGGSQRSPSSHLRAGTTDYFFIISM
jgi:hypothetical protein